MLIIIKSGPETAEGKRGISLARQMAADVVLLQDAVRFAAKGPHEDLKTGGKVYFIEDDARLAGGQAAPQAIRISYGKLVDLLASEDKVQGAF